MNIFEILSAGNRVLKEEHISAVLGWMLDPYHDHGLGMELLKRLSQTSFGEDAFISKALAEGEFSGLAMRDRSRLKIHTELEVTVQCNAGNERSIDILITINDNIFLAIENKTSRGSIQEAQLQEEVEGLNKAFRVGQDNKDNKLYFLFLTPSGAGPTINKAMNRIERDLCSAEPAHILWKKDERESDKASLSIAELLNGILLDEAGGSTSPLSSETKFLIKSFIQFIQNDFSYVRSKVLNAGPYYEGIADGLNVVRELAKLNDPIYIGFTGGASALVDRLKLAITDDTKRKELEDRPYKWSKDNKANGKKQGNWLPIEDFLRILSENQF
jgi:hypothetical protein